VPLESSELDVILAEMAELREEHSRLPPFAFDRRVEVQNRLTALHASAASLRSPVAADQEAGRARLARLTAELQRRLAQRVTHSAAAQTGQGGGIDPEYVHTLSRQLDASLELSELKAEIHRLTTNLDARWVLDITPVRGDAHAERQETGRPEDVPSLE
jgi:hypothetical protein